MANIDASEYFLRQKKLWDKQQNMSLTQQSRTVPDLTVWSMCGLLSAVKGLVQLQNVAVHLFVRDRGSTVAKVLCYKSEGRWFDPSWCQWIFH